MALIPPERGPQVLGDLEARFDRITVTYKTVHSTALEAFIFVPKTISATDATTAPVLVHFHGGALIMGTTPEPFFLADWVRDLAHSTPAIFISPSYRLAPETPGVEILTDVSDFWTWLHSGALPTALHTRFPHLTPDLTHLAAVGESAGGFLSIQSALLFNRTARLRAVIAQYPAMHPDMAGFDPTPAQANAELDAVVASYREKARAEPDRVVVSAPWPERVDLLVGAIGNGRLRELLGADPEGRLTFGYALAQGEEAPPPVWVVQGVEDVVVPKAATDELVETAGREKPGWVVKYTVREGGHGFDAMNTLEDDWVKEGVEFFKGYWL